jgi:sugar lactone lactonase YvrE
LESAAFSLSCKRRGLDSSAAMGYDAFVSYAAKDKPTADAVCAVLESQGIRCWIAPRDIIPGKDWGESIVDAIKGARVMVLVFTTNANSSQQIKREVERAVNKGIPVIPLRIEDVAPTASLEYFLSTPHWLDAFTPPLENHLQYLAQVIRQIIGGPATEILPAPTAGHESRERDRAVTAAKPEPPVTTRQPAAETAPPAKKTAKMIWIAAGMLVLAGVVWFLRPRTPPIAPAARIESAATTVPAAPTEPKQPLIIQNLGAVAVDSFGDVYVADEDNNTISKITPAGVLADLAGRRGTSGTLDGSRGDARFSILRGITVDKAGNLYVADSYTVRKITPAGDVSTLAGKSGTPGSVDGAGSEARFSVPSGVAVDDAGNVYVADTYTIRKITPAGVVSTLAGTPGHAGSADGAGASARFSDQTKGVAVDNEGNVYVADTYNNTIRKITPSGVVSTVAGASFSRPQGIGVDRGGNVYVADTYNNTIRKITPSGVVSTLAGAAGDRGNADGTGGNARFNDPQGIAADSRGNIYVADRGNQVIRKVTPNGIVSTFP